MKLDLRALARLPEGERERAEAELAEYQELLERDPLWTFVPHEKQAEFLKANTRIQAAFAGNRFGKTTALIVKAFIQHTPLDQLPDHLKPYKHTKSDVVAGRLVVPSAKVLNGVTLPALRKWAPRDILEGGEFDQAWSKQHSVLNFKDGGVLELFTYEQDADKFVGASCDYVGYDEPPPYEIRKENLARLIDRDGFEMYALTPVNMTGGGIGWIYRRIFKRKHEPHITVIQGSIWDNPTLGREAIEARLAEYPDEERDAREHGKFLHFGGRVYPRWDDHLVTPPSPEQVRMMDVIVGIDPSHTKSAFIWVGFDDQNRGTVFHEEYVEKGDSQKYVRAIRQGNSKWQLTQPPMYVIDPYAGNAHGHTGGQTVKEELARQGVHCVHPRVLDKDAIRYGGIQQIWRRMAEGSFHVSKSCTRLSDEAEEYRIEDRPDGVFQVVKENDDGMDAMRYAFTRRPWYVVPQVRDRHEEIQDFIQRGQAPAYNQWHEWAKESLVPDGPPMGSLS